MQRRTLVAFWILGGSLAIAGVLLSSADWHGKGAAAAPPQWAQSVGAGIIVSACGSANTQTSCQGGSPRVTFEWTGQNTPPGRTCRIVVNGSTIANGLNCASGSYTWNGAAPNTNYSYRIESE